MYYFTFGSHGQLFEGGWIRIQADSLEEAQQKFKKRYGEKAYRGDFLNYAFAYREEQFQFTIMARDGNFGSHEHEYIP